MKKIPKINTKKIIDFVKKLPWILGKKAFLTFLISLFIWIIIGGIIFYQSIFSLKNEDVKILEKQLMFKEKNYQNILEVWEEKEKNIEEINSKQYINPFSI